MLIDIIVYYIDLHLFKICHYQKPKKQLSVGLWKCQAQLLILHAEPRCSKQGCFFVLYFFLHIVFKHSLHHLCEWVVHFQLATVESSMTPSGLSQTGTNNCSSVVSCCQFHEGWSLCSKVLNATERDFYLSCNHGFIPVVSADFLKFSYIIIIIIIIFDCFF